MVRVVSTAALRTAGYYEADSYGWAKEEEQESEVERERQEEEALEEKRRAVEGTKLF